MRREIDKPGLSFTKLRSANLFSLLVLVNLKIWELLELLELLFELLEPLELTSLFKILNPISYGRPILIDIILFMLDLT